ncbi:MAG: DUF4093 domain-containing protein [Clostridia bacterium]
MLKINEIVVVEGKYDKIKLESIIDAIIVVTDGFSIFKDKEKIQMLKTLAPINGILIITDSDVAGFKIRNFLKSSIDNKYIKNVYIPDIFGKEKRKTVKSKEGKLGVEGIDNDIIITAIKNANVNIDAKKTDKKITKTTLYVLKLTGHSDSRKLRSCLLKKLNLPEHLSSNMLLDFLNLKCSEENLEKMVKEIETEII